MPSTSTLVDSIYTRRVSAGECYPPDLVKSPFLFLRSSFQHRDLLECEHTVLRYATNQVIDVVSGSPVIAAGQPRVVCTDPPPGLCHRAGKHCRRH